jgi:hypothetical protein
LIVGIAGLCHWSECEEDGEPSIRGYILQWLVSKMEIPAQILEKVPW